MFRPMRRAGQQLPEENCIAILKKAPRGVLSLLGDEGYPYGVPLDYVYEDGVLYFHCAKEGHKIDALKGCDKASFCVLDEGRKEEGEWWYHFESVIVFGRIRPVEEEKEKLQALQLIGGKYFPDPSVTEKEILKNGARVQILALKVEHMTGKHVREK